MLNSPVLNNETFAISEVDDPNLASLIARGVDPIDVGENIELYRELFSPSQELVYVH